MTQTRADILAYIKQHGPCRQTEIAAVIGIRQSGVSRHLDRMIADGVIRNIPFSTKVEAVRTDTTAAQATLPANVTVRRKHVSNIPHDATLYIEPLDVGQQDCYDRGESISVIVRMQRT